MRRLAYNTRYGYPLGIALVAEFWWRVEHIGDYQGGGMGSRLRGYAYAQRKAWERRGYARAKRVDRPSVEVEREGEARCSCDYDGVMLCDSLASARCARRRTLATTSTPERESG